MKEKEQFLEKFLQNKFDTKLTEIENLEKNNNQNIGLLRKFVSDNEKIINEIENSLPSDSLTDLTLDLDDIEKLANTQKKI